MGHRELEMVIKNPDKWTLKKKKKTQAIQVPLMAQQLKVPLA